jgi:chitin disaccharide deacetylase
VLKIIVNADDFGHSAETAHATIECFEAGALTSATIMPKMPYTKYAAEYARQNPQFSFGIHLTFVGDTIEAPVLEPTAVPTLTRPDGRFRASNRVRLDSLLGRLSVDQIAGEIKAQINFLRDQGVPISHVDSHGHLHKFRPFRAALQRVLPCFGINRVRNVQSVYLQRPLLSPTYWLGGLWKTAIEKSFVTTDQFYMPASGNDGAVWSEKLFAALPSDGTLEVGVHPGHEEEWRRREYTAARVFAERIETLGHRMITWNDLH